jgi:hypothetical protein
MDDGQRALAIHAIRNVKARYFRGVDRHDDALVRSILAADCVLDYRGCCTDPASGRDFLPQMNVVLRGREAWQSGALEGLVTVHQGHHADIVLTSDTTATGVWSMTDRFFFPPGSPMARLTGYGDYHETYVLEGGDWKIATLRIERLWVEAG